MTFLFINRFGAFNLRCSLTNTDVLDPVVTEEVYEDTACLDSNSLIPVVHLKADALETEGLDLLAGGTYVDTLLTTLPVSLSDSHPFFHIF